MCPTSASPTGSKQRSTERKHSRGQEFAAASATPPASRPGIGSPETWVCVRRKNKSRKGRPEYELLQAARDGCLRCVRHKLGEMPKLANMVSDTNAWTVHDFARHANGRRAARRRASRGLPHVVMADLAQEPMTG